MTTTLLHGAFIYTADPAHTIIPNGSILWQDDTILAVDGADIVEAHPAAAKARRIDGRGFFALPGFVNAHWHDLFAMRIPFKGALRSVSDRNDVASFMALGGDLPAISAMFSNFRSMVEAMTPDEAYHIAMYSMWTQMRSGVTTLGDVGSLNQPQALVDAARQLGIRLSVTTWATDIMCCPQDSAPTRMHDTDKVLDEIAELISKYSHDEHVKVRPCAAYGVNMSDELGLGLSELARSYDCGFATHVGALRNERQASLTYFGLSPVTRLEQLGLLVPGFMGVHPAYLDDNEAEILRRADAHLSFSPAKYGLTGESTLTETRSMLSLRRSGLPISISTDGGSLPVGGMVEAMTATWLGLNEMSADPTEVRASEALAMATLIPAEGLGWSRSVGSLEPGKSADMVLIKRDDWRYLYNPRPLEGLLTLGSSVDVDCVIAAGDVLVERGRSTRHDEDHLRANYLDSLTSFSQRRLGISPDVLAQLRRPVGQGGLL